MDTVSGATYSSTGILNAVKLALAKAAVAPAEETAPEQTASEETAEETAPSEAAKLGETPVTAPTVEVVQPEEESAVPVWLKEVWQQPFPGRWHRLPLNRHLLRKCCRHPSRHCRRKRPGLNLKRKEQQNEIQKIFSSGR